MSILSKLPRVPTTDASCCQVTHVWNPHCAAAIMEAVPMALLFSGKTYFTLYTLTALLKWRRTGHPPKWLNILKSTLRSSTFITVNMGVYLYLTCKIKQLFGFYWFGTFYLAGFLGSFVAILIEAKKRQSVLALYFANVASESMYMQLKNRGLVRDLPHGAAMILVVGLAALFAFRAAGARSDIHDILKLTHQLQSKIDEKTLPPPFCWVYSWLRDEVKPGDKCEHTGSCVSDVFARTFIGLRNGLGVAGVLMLLRVAKNPRNFFAELRHSSNFRIPQFAALMPLLYHGTQCVLRNFTNIGKVPTAALAGAASGAAMIVYPSSTVAMYMLWKAIERGHRSLREAGLLPAVPYGDILLYSISTGIVIANIIIEPHAVRGGYYKFIDGLTDGKVDRFNRTLLQPLGFDSDRMRLSREAARQLRTPLRIQTMVRATVRTQIVV